MVLEIERYVCMPEIVNEGHGAYGLTRYEEHFDSKPETRERFENHPLDFLDYICLLTGDSGAFDEIESGLGQEIYPFKN